MSVAAVIESVDPIYPSIWHPGITKKFIKKINKVDIKELLNVLYKIEEAIDELIESFNSNIREDRYVFIGPYIPEMLKNNLKKLSEILELDENCFIYKIINNITKLNIPVILDLKLKKSNPYILERKLIFLKSMLTSTKHIISTIIDKVKELFDELKDSLVRNLKEDIFSFGEHLHNMAKIIDNKLLEKIHNIISKASYNLHEKFDELIDVIKSIEPHNIHCYYDYVPSDVYEDIYNFLLYLQSFFNGNFL